MQMIEAVIKPHKLDAVKNALAKLGILGVTAIEVKGFGRQMGHTERYRGAKMDVGFVPKILLKVAVKSDDSQSAVKAIIEAARTGEVGNGQFLLLLAKCEGSIVHEAVGSMTVTSASAPSVSVPLFSLTIRAGAAVIS